MTKLDIIAAASLALLAISDGAILQLSGQTNGSARPPHVLASAESEMRRYAAIRRCLSS